MATAASELGTASVEKAVERAGRVERGMWLLVESHVIHPRSSQIDRYPDAGKAASEVGSQLITLSLCDNKAMVRYALSVTLSRTWVTY